MDWALMVTWRARGGRAIRLLPRTRRGRPWWTGSGSPRRADAGVVLLVVLIIFLIVGSSAASFVWFMNQLQTRAGVRHRSAAALEVAEAGIQRALSVLESTAPDGHSPGRPWRPAEYSEVVPVGKRTGRFTLSLVDADDGGVLVTSTGEVGGTERRLSARVFLASPAQLAGLHVASTIWLGEEPAATTIVAYGVASREWPWIHVAAGKALWFTTARVSLNDPSGVEATAGPLETPGAPHDAVRLPTPDPVRVLLGSHAELTLGQNKQRVNEQQLRIAGVRVGEVLRAEAFPSVPRIHRRFFQAQAIANVANAELNEAAGKYVGDEDLARKHDALYSREHFEKVQMYLRAGVRRDLRGIVYVRGAVAMADGEHLRIVDGSLIAEGLVRVGRDAFLETVHSPDTRALPGLLVADGALAIAEGAHVRVHGLLLADRLIDIGARARLDVVGAVLGNDPTVSLRNLGTMVIRYDSAVLGTPGLLVPEDTTVVAWVAAWEELPARALVPAQNGRLTAVRPSPPVVARLSLRHGGNPQAPLVITTPRPGRGPTGSAPLPRDAVPSPVPRPTAAPPAVRPPATGSPAAAAPQVQPLFIVQIGVVSTRDRTDRLMVRLRAAGFELLYRPDAEGVCGATGRVPRANACSAGRTASRRARIPSADLPASLDKMDELATCVSSWKRRLRRRKAEPIHIRRCRPVRL